jgi:hypothetical protein
MIIRSYLTVKCFSNVSVAQNLSVQGIGNQEHNLKGSDPSGITLYL